MLFKEKFQKIVFLFVQRYGTHLTWTLWTKYEILYLKYRLADLSTVRNKWDINIKKKEELLLLLNDYKLLGPKFQSKIIYY